MKYKLRCTKCSTEFDESEKVYNCRCGGKLEVRMNLDDVNITLNELRERGVRKLPVIEKYFEFLPLLDRENLVTLNEGYTPLTRSKRLAENLGLRHLYLKNETVNPTGSFKDRPIVVGVNRARELGAKIVTAASSGNAATSMAACAAKSGMRCVAFVPEHAPSSKVSQLLMYDALVIRVRVPENFDGDPTVKMMRDSCRYFDWHPVPSFGTFNPYQMEGAKTIGYEIAEEIRPDSIVIPVGGAGLFLGNYNAFREFKELGIVESMPVLHAVQSEGCAPFVKAFKGNGVIETWNNPRTIAGGLADPFTWDGYEGLRALRETGGTAETVSDDEIFGAVKLLARYEGIFAEPTGAAAFAGLVKLVDMGVVCEDEVVVCEVTGSGFKDMDTIEESLHKTTSVPVVEPEMEELERVLKGLGWKLNG